MLQRLVSIIVLAAVSTAELQWWQTSIIYQIYPRSFQDSNGDGVGDLKGIQSRLDHFKFLGVDAIWLSPIYESPMKDFGYDISNFTNIDPIFGTLKDFQELLEDMHHRGMKLIMDYVPNHTSDLHPWFQASKLGGTDNPYADYYVWNEGKLLPDGTRVPPNNWLSMFGGSAWEWVEERQAFYYHMFLKEQPDLNYRKPEVREDMKDIFRFWIEKGVDGFRVDAINTMFENHYDKDEHIIAEDLPEDEYLSYNHIFTEHQPEIHEVTKEWRDVFNEFEESTGKHIYMVMEVYDKAMVENMKYYFSGADMPFNFNLIYLTPDCGGTCIQQNVNSWMSNMPQGKWPNFVLGNHDNKRITTRKGAVYADALNLMLLTLPGTPTTYQGEEIAMMDIKVPFEETMDPHGKHFGPDRYEKYSRDPCRSPMQWSSAVNAGFSTAAKTWLPVGSDYKSRNVAVQKTASLRRSSLLMYQDAAALRRQPAFQNNHLKYCVIDDEIFSYIRSDGDEAYLVAINAGNLQSNTDFSSCLANHGYMGTIVLVTPDLTEMQIGKTVQLTNVKLSPGDAVVIKISQNKDEL